MLARVAAGFLSFWPRTMALSLGRVLGRLAHRFDRRGRDRAIQQVQRALEITAEEAAALAKRVYLHIGMVALEIASGAKLQQVELHDGDKAMLRRALDGGRGVIFVSAHVGNWELLAQRVAAEGFDAVTLARASPNPFIGRWLVQRRARAGVETINRGDPKAARKILSALKRGALLGVLIDQDTKVRSVHVPFFGRSAATPVAAAELALRRELPVVLGFIERSTERSDHHRVRLQEVSLGPYLKLPKPERVRALTAALTAQIESEIQRHPHEWVWFHDRWRTRP